MAGFEPTTSSSLMKRAPHCATSRGCTHLADEARTLQGLWGAMSQTKGTRHQLSAYQTSNSSGAGGTRTHNLLLAKQLFSPVGTTTP